MVRQTVKLGSTIILMGKLLSRKGWRMELIDRSASRPSNEIRYPVSDLESLRIVSISNWIDDSLLQQYESSLYFSSRSVLPSFPFVQLLFLLISHISSTVVSVTKVDENRSVDGSVC